MSFAVHIERTDTDIVISGIVNGETKEKWTVLDGPHLQHSGYSWATPYVYARVGSTGRTERLYLDNTQADQIRALQAV